MTQEEKIIRLQAFSHELQKEANLTMKIKSLGRAFKSGVTGEALKATKGSKSGMTSQIHKSREKAHSVGKHLYDNRKLYGTGAAAGTAGYILGSGD